MLATETTRGEPGAPEHRHRQDGEDVEDAEAEDRDVRLEHVRRPR